MYKIRNKKFALLLTIVFVLTIMMPLATPAFANTSYSALTTPTVTTGAGKTLGTLYVKIDPMPAGATAEAILSLPTDFAVTPGPVTSSGLAAAPIVTGPAVAPYGANEFKIAITKDITSGKAEVFIPLTATVPSGFSGDITVDVMGLSGQLISGKVVVGKVASGAVEVTVDSPDYLTSGSTVTFTIKENAAGALKLDAESMKFTLPKGYSWRANGTVTPLSGVALVATAPKSLTNDRVLAVNVTTVSTSKAIIRVSAIVDVDELDAKYGDVEVTLGGKSSVSPSKLALGKYADFGTKVTIEDATEILAGRYNVEVGTIVIEETAPFSFIANRTILLTLPSGAKWVSAGTITATDANVAASAIINSDKTLRLTLGAATAVAGKIEIEEATVVTKVNFGANDLKVKIEGSAGITGEAVVATVKPAATASADKPNLRIGVQAQVAGDIIITEAQAEALIKNKVLTISPVLDGITFEATPKAEVIEGDIDVTLKKAAGALTLEIDAESTVASKIKISGITLTVNRSVPEGNLELAVSDFAVDQANDFATIGAPWFGQDVTLTKVVNAACVTPAPGDAKQAASFVIGSSNYTLNGVEATMDVAPYVKDGRTYLPVRYVGYALGVAAENILWDGKTATLIKGDKVVQVTVGSKAMVVNGASINLDVAPELKDGRTMLPFRWIAWAFGAAVDWDAETQTVTMTL
ncbi:MAG: copper amine oxidase N-terminal domain-containing protein [Eubacteriales bacterium]|nr:copper amine oxidase N-terminal domain-containing protein [Eubacteriales bacterium]MDZ7609907.1 copper amine oxidase N-terminal domain-containing protein [Eubacteriales bacterium]